MTWKCGGGWSPKYIAMWLRLKRLTVGMRHSSATIAHAQAVLVGQNACRVASGEAV
jgi:hypothetical protein